MAKKPWELLAETNDVAEGEPRSGEGATSKNQIFTEWLSLLDKLRTFFKENPDAEF
ncbi:MAG: hypothetical protein HYZ51_04175 [Candidatus Doudnabacteria bacterium]|nr:hypothetical protein [Candidatus Doudnabacteria bacterium]